MALAGCLLLVLAVGFSSLGLAFAVGAVGRRDSAPAPARAFAPLRAGGRDRALRTWCFGYGHEAESAVTAHNVLKSPIFFVKGLSASVGALTGLSVLSGDPGGKPYLGFAALVALVAALAWRLRRPPGLASRFWPVAATAATFWFLSAFAGREAVANRYMHFGAILILMMVADLLAGVRFRVRALAATGAIVVLATAINLTELDDGADWLGEQSVLTRADIGAMEIAERTVAPTFYVDPTWAGTPSLVDVGALITSRPSASTARPPTPRPSWPPRLRPAANRPTGALRGAAGRFQGRTGPATGARRRCIVVGARAAPADASRRATPDRVAAGSAAAYSLRRYAPASFRCDSDPHPAARGPGRIPRDARGAMVAWVKIEASDPRLLIR